MILFRTLLNRDLWMNPLSDVMGGWGIWETVNGERQLTTECIENVILMMPFTGMVMWTFDVEKGVVWKSTKLGLIFSVSIEMLQLLVNETDCVSGGTLTLGPRETVALAALIITHLYAVSSRQQSKDWLRCEELQKKYVRGI